MAMRMTRGMCMTGAPADRLLCAGRTRVQQELLHAPVQDLGHVELVLRRAGDLVDPAELLQLLPGLAQHAQDLPVERHLIYTSRERIGRVEHLVRTGRDAEGPRRARA